MTVRIASWNVESVRAHHDQVLNWLDRNNIDVLCMQETKAGVRTFPRNHFEAHGYHLRIHGGDNGRGGVAIASRLPLDDVIEGIPGAVAPLDEPRCLSATVAGLRLHTVYAPNGRKVGTHHHEIKLAWFELLATWLDMELADTDSGAQLLTGDLNIAPTDTDVWEPRRYRRRNLTSPRERAAFDRLLADGTRVDLVRHALGDEPLFTWWNRRADFYETDRGWRLDHALATPAVTDRHVSLTIDRTERGRPGSTDHAPLLIELES